MVRATRSATRTSPRSRSSGKTTGRSRRPMHPSWTEMITDCIVTTPDGTQNGVSRPTLKKFVEFNYHLVMSPTTTGQLNRAITVGTEKGNFVLPKGPSGKVKLAPERTTGTPKENAKQNSKRVSSAKTTTTMHPRKTATATKKYTSRAKKGRTTSTSTASRKTAKKPSTRRAAAKKGTSRSTARAKTLKRPSVSSSTRRRASAK
ncbi:hypothetical protein PISMIDRAFT_139234 [Pisolithus microcarpus 441]|uniref:Histone H1 n=1 Tax=Pisolithus microcarpus 441 TaxID=765257 RepID=A0A0C9ZZ40_9AGAM|nr:hypothetical protein PISMIDRAFT_139234 [Pisolithus microcarpus 441]